MDVMGTLWHATMSPERYVGCMETPFMGMRKSAPLNAGTTYRSHSYSRAVSSPDRAPAIALKGIKGMPSFGFFAFLATLFSAFSSIFPSPVRSHWADRPSHFENISSISNESLLIHVLNP